MIRALTAAAMLGALASPAQAANIYMWGVGPRIGTNFLPSAYPSAFPRIVADDRVDDTDEEVISKVRGDFLFGIEAHYYVDGGSRIGLDAGLGFGKRYFDAHALLKYNRVISSASVDFLFGGGAGFGTQTFRGDDNDARLRVPYFPLRLEISGMVRANFMAFQLTPYVQYNLPANHFYTDETGADIDVKGGFYPTVGIELAVLFGDYDPPAPRKRR